ncbi:FAD-dependent hydroxylase [Leptolyngbya sp. FACHB-16]|nr:FAD-dependent hydroxylase [Leptolyngbya sp. FACHB-16]MBD1910360.1 FAD-dependent hydroxylase [Leptolyngbya sp. FACHB-8]MBD2154837.1 FAD-dependent hydroxylase [Leptolyngbya sp. FACHB-16]
MVLDSQTVSSAQSEFSVPAPLDYDVAIAGGGPVGLTLAAALKDSGLRVALIEARPLEAGLTFNRAYALTLMTGRIFTGLGIWDEILPQITTFDQIRLADETCPAIVNLQPADLGTAELGYVGEHHVLVRALLNCLKDASNLDWYYPASLMESDYREDAVHLTLSVENQIRTVRVGVLVAADGSRSPIRQAAGIGTRGWQYWQSCVTAVIRPEKSHQNIAREHFWASGPFATLPLPGNRCQIVLTAPHAEAQHWLEVDEVEFLAELNRRYGGQLGRLELLGNRALFPVKWMQCDRYSQRRLALVGDAAHACHPVGGQGLNLGIRDAVALAEVLQQAHQQGENLGAPQVLRRYERWRQRENLLILAFTDFLDRSFSSPWPPLVVLRRLGLRLMQRVPLLRRLALLLMTGLSGRYPLLAQKAVVGVPRSAHGWAKSNKTDTP